MPKIRTKYHIKIKARKNKIQKIIFKLKLHKNSRTISKKNKIKKLKLDITQPQKKA